MSKRDQVRTVRIALGRNDERDVEFVRYQRHPGLAELSSDKKRSFPHGAVWLSDPMVTVRYGESGEMHYDRVLMLPDQPLSSGRLLFHPRMVETYGDLPASAVTWLDPRRTPRADERLQDREAYASHPERYRVESAGPEGEASDPAAETRSAAAIRRIGAAYEEGVLALLDSMGANLRGRGFEIVAKPHAAPSDWWEWEIELILPARPAERLIVSFEMLTLVHPETSDSDELTFRLIARDGEERVLALHQPNNGTDAVWVKASDPAAVVARFRELADERTWIPFLDRVIDGRRLPPGELSSALDELGKAVDLRMVRLLHEMALTLGERARFRATDAPTRARHEGWEWTLGVHQPGDRYVAEDTFVLSAEMLSAAQLGVEPADGVAFRLSAEDHRGKRLACLEPAPDGWISAGDRAALDARLAELTDTAAVRAFAEEILAAWGKATLPAELAELHPRRVREAILNYGDLVADLLARVSASLESWGFTALPWQPLAAEWPWAREIRDKAGHTFRISLDAKVWLDPESGLVRELDLHLCARRSGRMIAAQPPVWWSGPSTAVPYEYAAVSTYFEQVTSAANAEAFVRWFLVENGLLPVGITGRPDYYSGPIPDYGFSTDTLPTSEGPAMDWLLAASSGKSSGDAG